MKKNLENYLFFWSPNLSIRRFRYSVFTLNHLITLIISRVLHKAGSTFTVFSTSKLKLTFLCLATLVTLPTFAQNGHTLTFWNSSLQQPIKTVTLNAYDTAQVNAQINRFIASLWTKGYASAGMDSVVSDSSNTNIFIYKGNRILRVRLRLITDNKANLLPTAIKQKKFSRFSLLNTTDLILSKMENQGYPFAMVVFDSVNIEHNTLSGNLRLVPGTFVVFDTLIVKGKYRANRNYLDYLLGATRGMPYSEKQVRQIGSTISQLEYLSTIRPAETEFIPNKARVYVYLKQKKANQISALIGLAGKETGGGVTFRGDVNLKLINTFNIGEEMQLLWKKLETNEQRLEASATLPWLGLGGFGSTGSLSIYRKDTSTLVVNPKIGITWNGITGHRLTGWFELKKVASSTTNVAGYGNSNSTLYGLGYSYYRFESNLFPTSEISITTGVALGSRLADYETSGQTVTQASTAYSLNAKAGVYHTLAGRLGLYCAYRGGAVGAFGGNGYNQLFYNELLRVGGYSTLRGFDEDFFWVSSFHIATAEARYYFESEGYAFLFVDTAYLERSWLNGFDTFKPTGVGVGTQLEVSGGLFQLAYALGSSNGGMPQFKDAKVHFGFTARF
jgi:hypothetical protein